MLTKAGIFSLLLFVCAALLAGNIFSAEETNHTPSDQMKEAVNKLNKAPATIGKSLKDLTDAAKEQLRQTFGGKARTDPKASAADLSLPKKSPETPAPANGLSEANRDPFRPMTLKAKVNNNRQTRENLSPLERLELSQLKLVGIVWDIKDPRAMVEDSAGLGYVVKVGTSIGGNDGKVKTIHRNEVVVEEFYFDDYGARKKRDVGMKLLTE